MPKFFMKRQRKFWVKRQNGLLGQNWGMTDALFKFLRPET